MSDSSLFLSRPGTMSRLTVVEGDIITWGTVGALYVNREKTEAVSMYYNPMT